VQERLHRPVVQEALERYAPGTGAGRLDRFMAGLLLWDQQFRDAATGGLVYTEDRLGLQYSVGRHVSPTNLDALHGLLTPWEELRRHLPGFDQQGLNAAALTARRERLFTLSYSPYPARYAQVALDYIRDHSPTPRQDLVALHAYLTRHGLEDAAAQVARMLGESP
jgi:hypothetical protein